MAKAILGDILGVGYTIDPRVQGTVSLSSGRAVPRKDLLFVLENALRMSGVALVRDGARLSSDSHRRSGRRGFGRLGARSFGRIWHQRDPVAICVGADADQAARQLRSQAGHGARGAIPQPHYHSGKRADRRAAIQTALSFDADWMTGSIGWHLSGQQQHA